ncbi:DUF456 domain-containing protein, partial [Patescibacteria group bacterium]|nr:DUF456 domain-containing protein [Patescibacteria group bacterium]
MVFGEIIIFILAILVMLVGLAGIIIPILPGIPLIMAAVLIYGLIDGWQAISWNLAGIFAILTVAALTIDWLATTYGVKKMGGSTLGIIGAIGGMVVGLFSGGIIGLIVGAFVGAFVFELIGGKNKDQALRAGLGSFIGFIAGGVIKFAIGASMIGVFIWQVLF